MENALPKRKPQRLRQYNYSTLGAYFITICTKDKLPTLCSLVGGGVLDAPECRYTEKGTIVAETLREMSSFYADITIEKYVVMPNHIHLLLTVTTENGQSRTPAPTNGNAETPANALVPRFVSTLKRYTNQKAGENLWQRSFHDHIVRDERDYLRIWNYIDTNPVKWQDDCYYISK